MEFVPDKNSSKIAVEPTKSGLFVVKIIDKPYGVNQSIVLTKDDVVELTQVLLNAVQKEGK